MARFSITLPDALLNWIDDIGEAYDLSRSDVVATFTLFCGQHFEEILGFLNEELEEDEDEEEEEEEEEE